MPQLRIVVLVKQVPDTANVTGEAMKEDGTVNRAALPAVFNPEDLNALEEALKLKDRHGARVTVVTMGPPAAVQVLRESLYRGADEVILLTDKAFAGADTLATSYALSLAVRKLGGCDLVLCGRQAIDGDTAQVGPQTAEKLGYPQITCVSRIDELVAPADGAAGAITATRSIEGGFETLTSSLPCLLTVTGEANDPRPPSVKLVMTYKGIAAEAMPEYDDTYLDPESDAAEVCMLGRDGKPVCRAKVVQWDHLALEADREALGPARLADAREGDRERRARAERGAHGRAGRSRRGGARPRAHRGAHPWLAAGGDPVSGARNDVWVVVEQHDGVAAEVSLELLGRARELAATLGVGTGAVLAGAGEPVRALAPALIALGADTVYLADHDDLGDYLALPYTRLVAGLIRAHRPQIVLYGATTTGRDLAPRVASALRTGLTADCTDLRIGDFSAKGETYSGLLFQIRPAFGGNIIATIVSPEHRPQMATVREGVMVMPEADESRTGTVVAVPVERSSAPVNAADRIVLTDADFAVRLVKRVQEEKRVDLKGARVVVSGGVGVGSREGFALVEELARAARRRRRRQPRRRGRGLGRATSTRSARPAPRCAPSSTSPAASAAPCSTAPAWTRAPASWPSTATPTRPSSRWPTTGSSATCTRSSLC